ncbi:DUF4142 domain-containing protein [Acetobacter sp. TBRC 12305]|uniref:DUF4142 domain-containing protein n=1 Tax=Acetobacter garciniae TaxID=2817435 RepID=A0A939HNI2_9PROT|nr:DUF4142 domain-containing protein [Acetobacter garciniae]MBO1324963.1 DUF4142 domain-containing protein [Acetobacter garciniae]MBX0344654.1 DUF4142 domain-containing protein [Acetobacter garciniae]
MSLLPRFSSHAPAALIVALLALGACVNGQPPAPPLPPLQKAPAFTVADATFAQALNDMDLTQIALAQMVPTHAARADLAALGATIAKDLTANQATLTKLVSPHAISLATKPSSADQKNIDQLKGFHGAAFDRRYIRYFSRDQARMKPVLESEIANSKNPDLVKLATDTKTLLAGYAAQLK